MAINYPTSLDSFPNPGATDKVNNATAGLKHHTQHSNVNDAVEALEIKVGINGSADTSSLDYKTSSITSTDKAVAKDVAAFTGGKVVVSVAGDTVEESTMSLTPGGILDIASGGTGRSLSDPGANKLFGWDDVANQFDFITVGSGLSLSSGTIVATGTALNLFATANEDLTSGQSVGISSLGGGIARALRGKFTFTTPDTIGVASSVALGSDRIFVLYKVNSATTLKGVVLTVNRDTMTISAGTAVTYSSTLQGSILSACLLDTDKVAVMYTESGAPEAVKIHVSTIATSTITAGTQQAFVTLTNNCNSLSLVKIDTDKAIAYTEETSVLNPLIRAFTVSGTTLGTVGTGVTSLGVRKMASHTTGAVTLFGFDTDFKIQIATVSGTTITIGSAVLVQTQSGGGDLPISIAVIDSTHVCIGYEFSTAKRIRVASISGTTPTLGTAVDVGSLATAYVFYDTNSSRLIVNFQNAYTSSGTTLSSGYSIIGTGYVSGTLGNVESVYPGSYYVVLKMISTGNEATVEGMCGTFLPAITTQSTSRGGTLTTLIKGSDSNQSGIIAGQKYTADGLGGLTINSSGSVTGVNSTTVIL